MTQTHSELMRVLVVEDDPDYAALVVETLRDDAPPGRMVVEVAPGLSKAMEIVRAAPPDAILLDLGLPEETGLDTLRRMHHAAPVLPVVVLTQLDDDVTAMQSLRLGAQDYLVKGDHEDRLYGVLRTAVERQRHLLDSVETARRAGQGRAEIGRLRELVRSANGSDRLANRPHQEYADLVQRYAMLYVALASGAPADSAGRRREVVALADDLCALGASPRDVVDLHTEALKHMSLLEDSQVMDRAVDDGRLVLLELMGLLVSAYRAAVLASSELGA